MTGRGADLGDRLTSGSGSTLTSLEQRGWLRPGSFLWKIGAGVPVRLGVCISMVAELLEGRVLSTLSRAVTVTGGWPVAVSLQPGVRGIRLCFCFGSDSLKVLGRRGRGRPGEREQDWVPSGHSAVAE